MYVLHAPIMISAGLDVAFKRPESLAAYTPSLPACLACLTAYNVCFNAFLRRGYLANSGAIPYPW